MDIQQKYTVEIEAFGRQLRQIRESKNLSQLDLEILSGLNRTEISRIENGQKNIEFLTIIKLADALGVALQEFFPPLSVRVPSDISNVQPK